MTSKKNNSENVRKSSIFANLFGKREAQIIRVSKTFSKGDGIFCVSRILFRKCATPRPKISGRNRLPIKRV